jgi:hypothetical protein
MNDQGSNQSHNPPRRTFLPPVIAKAQRTTSSLLSVSEVPPIVHEVLESPGQPLDTETRAFMEPRFGHDFSHVRVHNDAKAAESAQMVNALAYTVGHDVVFGMGQYSPGTRTGQKLLSHELTHAVQQNQHSVNSGTAITMGTPGDHVEQEAHHTAANIMANHPASTASSERQPTLRRQEGVHLQEPQLGQSLGFRRSRIGLGVPQLRLDPEIEAQLRVIELLRGLVTLDNIRTGVTQLGGGRGSPNLFPPLGSGVTGRPQPAGGLGQPLPPAPAPLVPPPTPRPATLRDQLETETARPASIGDLLDAVLAIPSVDSAVTRLRTQAEGEVRRNWHLLSTGERALVITQGVLIAGGAIAGVASDPAARQFVLDQVQGRTIPIPGLPVTFQFNLTGPDQRLVIGLDVGALLPSSLGFHGSR